MHHRKDAHYNVYTADTLAILEEDFAADEKRLSEFACRNAQAVRRVKESFHPARPNFAKDTERILNCRYFNRYADKTQVFSLYRNDDITRRIQHVQIVSRIARSIGRMLRLNTDLIEAIALAHDLGHPPFGHLGERVLSSIVENETGHPFRHSVQSVRILDRLLGFNLTIQVLDGVLTHGCRPVDEQYAPVPLAGQSAVEKFSALDKRVRILLEDPEAASQMTASTLEGGVVRLADVLAYLGKDRQDARLLGLDIEVPFSENPVLGSTNSEFIFNTIQNLVENSYGKPYLHLDTPYAEAIASEKRANYDRIYAQQNETGLYDAVHDMFVRVYDRCMEDLRSANESSPVYRHHILKSIGGVPVNENRVKDYLQDPPSMIAADYIASMTDDYLMDVHEYMYPGASELRYESYFSTPPRGSAAPNE